MRVGIAVYGDLANRSGGYLYDARLVAALEARGHEVEVVPLGQHGYREELRRPPTDRLVRAVREHDLDLLLEDELVHPSLIAANSRLRGQLPLVSIVHNLSCQVAISGLERELFAKQERTYLLGMDAFLFNSQATRGAVERLMGRRPPGIVAYPGRDHLGPIDLVDKDFDAHVLEVLYIGNLLPFKGLDVLVRALAELERGRFRLWAAGAPMDPRFAASVQELILRLGLEEEATLLGRVGEPELRGLLGRSHLLAAPSLHEGFGLVYVEAMGHGLPVMASASGGAREFVDEGVQGFLIPPGDHARLAECLEMLHRDRGLLRSMSRAARARYQRLPTWQESMGLAVDFLEGLLLSFQGARGL